MISNWWILIYYIPFTGKLLYTTTKEAWETLCMYGKLFVRNKVLSIKIRSWCIIHLFSYDVEHAWIEAWLVNQRSIISLTDLLLTILSSKLETLTKSSINAYAFDGIRDGPHVLAMGFRARPMVLLKETLIPSVVATGLPATNQRNLPASIVRILAMYRVKYLKILFSSVPNSCGLFNI